MWATACASGLHPTLRNCAKDGAPKHLWLVESDRVGHPPTQILLWVSLGWPAQVGRPAATNVCWSPPLG